MRQEIIQNRFVVSGTAGRSEWNCLSSGDILVRALNDIDASDMSCEEQSRVNLVRCGRMGQRRSECQESGLCFWTDQMCTLGVQAEIVSG